MNNNYENKILDAIQTLVDSAVSRAGYDKTIKAIVSKCVDESKGKYVVRYQDSTFYAYSNNLDAVYSGGTSVYVLVPGNDMSQTKTILGSVDKLGSDYITLTDSAAAYQEVGSSIIEENTNEFGVSSYKEGGDSLVLYNRESGENSLGIDVEGAQIYFQNASYMEIGGTFRTTLPEEQKRKGNYGLIFDMDFKDGDTITNQKYVIDINSMTGNPYTYNYGSEQNAIYQIDGEHFYRLNSITLECKNFPKNKTPYTSDIFVKDIILKALIPLTRDEIANNSLTFITKQGIYFSGSDEDETKLIETEVRINQKIIPNTDLLRFYWFKEDSTIGLNSPDYLPYGGPGWKCINEYNIIDETTNLRDYIVNKDTLTVVARNNPAKENEYKCVVIYNDSIQVERNIIIYNLGANYVVTIESDEGNSFQRNNGTPTLTCTVTPSGAYTYVWTETNSFNRTEVLEETSNTCSIQLGKIANFSKFTCSVFSDGNFLGKSNIVITNSWDKNNDRYSLVMENADQVFKYNEKGIAPNNKSLDKPIIIKPLQFIIYDEFGHQVEDNKILATDVTWYIPKDNTMIKKPSGELPEEDGYYIYSGQKTLDIDIVPIYNNRGMNNIIKLKVKYDNWVLNAQSELTFIKEGEIGSNGTDFVCRIVPNIDSGALAPSYPIYTYNGTNGDMNYDRPSGALNKWFKIQLFKDGTDIFTGTASGSSSEGKTAIIEWSILKNKYAVNKEDDSNFTVDSSTGEFSFTNLSNTNIAPADEPIDIPQDRAANIVKVEVTYDGATYYATMPIILVKVTNSAYSMDVVENTGFRYAMYTTDGLNPVYDSSNPFTLKVYKMNGATKEDVTTATDANAVVFDWSTIGSLYNGTAWVAENNFFQKSEAHNIADYRPVETFNGLSVNNAVKCLVSKNGSECARIYLPIHFYLNRFGNAALNGWDGNHIEINNNGGFILSPQIGAGTKDANNRFTGIFMGSVKESGASAEEVGLFGYSGGERTIALDAQDGSAKFGKAGAGQITIDPNADSARIYSGDFRITSRAPGEMTPRQTSYQEGFRYIRVNGDNVTLLKLRPAGTSPLAEDEYRIGDSIKPGDRVWVDGDGLEIDLNDPHIIFGNGNFRVDSDGQVYATGFVTVTKLEAGDYNIPGTNIFDVENPTNMVQFEANAQLYPTRNDEKSITCKCKYKEQYTNNYTVNLIDNNGTVIEHHDQTHMGNNWDGVDIVIDKNQETTAIKFKVYNSYAVNSTILSYRFRFTYPTGLIVDRIFNVNLIVKGTSIAVKGSFNSTTDLLNAVSTGTITPSLGDSYLIDRHIWIYTNDTGHGGTVIGDWYDGGEFQGDPGEDAKQIYLTPSSDSFKVAANGQSCTPISITITPFFQNTSFRKWSYSTDGGNNFTELDESNIPQAYKITFDNLTKGITVDWDSSLYTSVSVLVFKCTTQEIYDTIEESGQTINIYYSDTVAIAKLRDGLDGAPGNNGRTMWITATDPVSGVFQINDLTGPSQTPAVGELIILDNRYEYSITAVDTEHGTVTATYKLDMQGTPGTNGNNSAIVYLYRRANSVPDKPFNSYQQSDNLTYNFATGQLGNFPQGWSGWSQDASSSSIGSGDKLYVSMAQAYDDDQTTTISCSNSNWSTPAIVGEKGATGAAGTSPFLAKLSNENHTFAPGIATTVSNQLEAYRGSTELELTLIKVNDVSVTNATTPETAKETGIGGLKFYVSTVAEGPRPIIYFLTTSALQQNISHTIPIEYHVKGEEAGFNRTINFSCSTPKAGENARLLYIEQDPAITFKSIDGGSTFSPENITLTPRMQYTTFGNWYYNNNPIYNTPEGSSSTNLDHVSLNPTTHVLTINYQTTLFTANVRSITFEARNGDGDLKDRITISKAIDAINTFIRYSINQPTQDSDVRTDPTNAKYIGVYNGPLSIAPTSYNAYAWSKYVGDTGNGINSITYKYQATQSPSPKPSSDDPPSGSPWHTNINDTGYSSTNKYLWRRELIDYTIASDAVDVSLAAVYGDTGSSVYNIGLENESIVIAGDTSAALVGTYTTDVWGTLGTTAQELELQSGASISGVPSGMTASWNYYKKTEDQTQDDKKRPYITLDIQTANTMVSPGGIITVPIQIVNGPAITKKITYALSLIGEDGKNSATVAVYQRAASVSAISDDDITYNFTTHQLSDTPSQWAWSETVPSTTAQNNNPLWVCYASVSSTSDTVTIDSTDWTTPRKLVENGEDGVNGEDAISLKIKVTDGNTIFRNNTGTVTLEAHVYKGEAEQPIGDSGQNEGKCGDLGYIIWYINNQKYDGGHPHKSIILNASNVNNLAYVTCQLEYVES